MGKPVVKVTSPDGTKKILVGKPSTGQPVKTRENINRRPKPGTPKIGISHERNGYKRGGKITIKIS